MYCEKKKIWKIKTKSSVVFEFERDPFVRIEEFDKRRYAERIYCILAPTVCRPRRTQYISRLALKKRVSGLLHELCGSAREILVFEEHNGNNK